jgi:pyrroline-5-carboxylate reductase
MNSFKIGFIGGGQMAEAIIKGLQKNGLDIKKVYVSEPSEARKKYLKEETGVNIVQNSAELLNLTDVIILAVKPQIIKVVLSELKGSVNQNHLIVSIAAGITINNLEDGLPDFAKVVRVMPNTPAMVMEAMSVISKGKNATEDDLDVVRKIMGAIGRETVLPEKMMDAVTALSGSGPAYVFLFIDSLISAGVREGLSRDVATELALQTVIGSAIMMKETKKKPAELVEMVTSPGGTTIEALFFLEKNGFKGIIMEALRGARIRSEELKN